MATLDPYWRSCFTGKQAEEKDACLNCPLPDCVDRLNPKCPLRAAELKAKGKRKEAHVKRVLHCGWCD